MYEIKFIHKGETTENPLYTPGDTSYCLTAATLSLEVGAAGELSVSIPDANPAKSDFVCLTDEIIVYRDGEELWRGRAITRQEDFYRTGTLTCEGVLAYLYDTYYPPFEFSGSPTDCLQAVLDNHNAQVEERKQFQLGTVTVEDNNDYIARSSIYYNRTLTVLTEKLINDSLGGYFRVRIEGGVKYLDYLSSYGTTATQPVEFGVNLLDIAQNVEYSDLATVILPLGAKLTDEDGNETNEYLTIADVNGGSIYYADEAAVEEYGWIVVCNEWEDVTEASNLLTKAQNYLAQVTSAVASFEVSAVDLALVSAEYDYINLGDYVLIQSDPHGINQYVELTSMKIDLLDPANDTLTFGADTASLTDSQRSSERSAQAALESTATRITNLVATTITTEYLSANYITAGEIEANYIKADELEADVATFGYVKADELEATVATFGYVTADSAVITDLTAKVATIDAAYITAAEVDTLLADYATISELTAYKAEITELTAGYVTAGEVDAILVEAGYLTADSAAIKELQADVADINTLLADYATVEYLTANYATINELTAYKAEVTELTAGFVTASEVDAILVEAGYLTADSATITDLTAEVANINSVLAGNVGAGTIETVHLTSENVVIDDAVITDAMIVNLTASKLTAGTIYTSLVKIASDSGENLLIDGSTIQINDGTYVRVQIGEDASGDYNLYLWDASGNLLWDAEGLYAAGIHDGIIKDVAVAEDAAISGTKLDIASVAECLNEDGSITVNATQVTIDDTTLEYRLTTMTTATGEAQAAADAAAAAAAELESEAVASLTQYYALGTSDTEPPSDPADNVTRAPALVDTAIVDESRVDIVYADTDWTTEWLTSSDGLYLWTAFYVEYADGHTGWTTPTCLTDGVARESISTLVTELEVVQGQISAKVWQSDIDEAVDELGADITALSDKYASLTLTIDGITAEVADIKTTVADNYEALESKITTVETTASGISATVSDLQDTVTANYTDLNDKITTVETTASGITATVTDLQSTVSSNYSDLSSKIATVETTASDISATVEDLQTTVTDNYTDLSDKVSELTVTAEGITGTVSDLQSTVDDNYETLSNQIATVETTASGITATVEDLQSTVDGNYETLSSRITTVETTASGISATVSDLQSTVDGNYTTLDDKIAALTLTTDGITASLSTVTTATETAQSTADAAAAAAAELESESVTSLTQYYAMGNSAEEPPSDPADNVTRAPALVDTAIVDESRVDVVYSETDWTTERPTVTGDLYLWTAFYVVYVDGHTGWTTPTCVSDDVARSSVSTLQTDLAIVQGQITAKVWQTDIDEAVDSLGNSITVLQDRYTSVTQTISGIETEIADITTTVSDNYTDLESKITTVSETADGITASVSDLQATVGSNYTDLSSKISTVSETADSISGTVSSLQTTVGENYTELSDKIASLELTADGISATVSSVQGGLSDLSDTVDGTVTNAVTYFAISGDTEPPCDPGEDIVDATVDTAIVDESRVGCVGWSTDRPTVGEDEYLWMCYRLTMADGSTTWTEPVLVTDDYMRTSVASLTITAESITTEVSTLAGELSEVEQTATSLKSKVQSDFDVLSSEITQLADSISLCVTTDSDTGYLRLGAGDDGTVKFTVDTDNFTIDEDGNVTMAGKVTATSGTVGGWNINSQKIYGTAADGTTTAVMQISGLTEDTAYVFACGGTSHSSYADCPFRVNKIGGMWVQDVIVAEGLVAGTNISATGNVYATALVGDNDGGLYCKDTDGTARRVAYLSINDNMVLGNTNFPTYLYGTTIYANDMRVKEVQHGNVAISVSAADTPTSVEVTFPTAFSGVPDVVVSAATSSPATSFVGVLSPSATGCTIYLTRTTTGEITVRWMAAY